MAKNKKKKGGITVAEAGRRGGMKTAETHGRDFYQSIGEKGGRARAKKMSERKKKEDGE